MSRCDRCGNEVVLPFSCQYCGGRYCADCRLPPNHDCVNIALWNSKPLPSVGISYGKGGRATPPGDNSGVKYVPETSLPGPQYYTGIDFDTLKSNDHLTVLPLKSYRQQVTNYSCGAVSAMTVVSWYGKPVNNSDADEEQVARDMYPNVSEKTGINPEQIVAWFKRQGMNASWSTSGSREMLRENLKNGIPTMVEWMD